jgi:hypothetical protein
MTTDRLGNGGDLGLEVGSGNALDRSSSAHTQNP